MRVALTTAVTVSGVGSVVGESCDARDAVALAAELDPDLVVLDVQLSHGDTGITVCRDIKARAAAPRVLVYTATSSSSDVAACFLSGADGFIHKTAPYGELVDGLRAVARGEVVRWLGPGLRPIPASTTCRRRSSLRASSRCSPSCCSATRTRRSRASSSSATRRRRITSQACCASSAQAVARTYSAPPPEVQTTSSPAGGLGRDERCTQTATPIAASVSAHAHELATSAFCSGHAHHAISCWALTPSSGAGSA